jgi:predicted N-acetyltransferase YhbS
VIVRRERPDDESAIARLIDAAFGDRRGSVSYPPFFPPPPVDGV